MVTKYLWDTTRAALLLLAVMLALPALSAEETLPTASDMEILREKIYADKKLLVAENMELTEEEAKKFWPVYEAYQEDLHKINGRIANIINEYRWPTTRAHYWIKRHGNLWMKRLISTWTKPS